MNNAILIDTNAYSAFKRCQKEAVDIILRAEKIILTPIVYGELLSGFRLGNKEAINVYELALFLQDPKVHFIEINKKTSEAYAVIFQTLREKGRPIPTNDLWLAAMCLQLKTSIFTYDKHFHEIEDLRIIGKRSDRP